MNFKKALAFILAAQMLLAAVACNKPADDETDAPETNPVVETNAPETDAPAVETEPAETEFDRMSVSDELPEMNFGDKDFRFMSQERDAYQVYSEDTSGVGLDAEIYARNQRVEERFGVKIGVMTTDILTQDKIVQYTNVGEHVCEVVVHTQEGANTPPIYFGFENWNDIPYLNFDKPWWNKEAIDNYTFGGYTFNLSSDLSISSMELAWCLAVNADLMEDWGYSIDSLYQLVRDGEWTLDKMIEITNTLWNDTNGDGLADAEDEFGYGSPVNAAADHINGGIGFFGTNNIPWVTTLGEQVMTKNPDNYDMYEITILTEKLVGALETLVNFHNNSKGVSLEALDTTYTSGNLGIYTAKFDIFRRYADVIDFTTGVLPFPKYDAAQEEYLTSPDNIFSMFGLPITIPKEDHEMVGAIMEALSAESYKTTMPAYFDEALKGRYSSDEGMAEMVQLIADGRTFDYSGSCAQSFPSEGKLPYTFSILIRQNNTDLASVIAQYRDHIERSISELLIFYNVIEYDRWGQDGWEDHPQFTSRFGEPRYFGN